ncbi:MAG: hypothetical protein COA79_21805 [Planctomycetota bacterium]|nr:MAG: hypothetical protein COA79_21805 [Planctomycetota bacterium]
MTQLLDGIPLQDITEDQLNSLLLLKIPESAQIEYKSEIKMGSDKDKRELCKDVSALANSQGGYLFFGISETNDIPSDIPGITFNDTTSQQLFQIIMSGITPRIQSLVDHVINLKNGLQVLVLKIEHDGYLHQVKYNDNRFYKRVGTITITMESSDVESFVKSTSTNTRQEDVQETIDTYYGTLKEKKYFKGIEGKGICALTIIPEVSSIKLDIGNLPGDFNSSFPPIYCSGWGSEITGHSKFTFGKRKIDIAPYTVTEVNDLGEVKAFNTFIFEDKNNTQLPEKCVGNVPSIAFEREIITSFHKYLTSLKEFGVTGSFFIHTVLLNIQGYMMYVGPKYMIDNQRILEVEDIRPPFIQIPSGTNISTQHDVAKIIRPMFDYIWREFGFERSYNYSSEDDWVPHS